MTWPVTSSATANRIAVSIAMVQPVPAAAAMAMGKTAAPSEPMYGMKRMKIADDAPEHRARDADHRQRGRDDEAESGVQQHLGQEIAAEPARRIVHGQRGALDVAEAEQPDETIAQIFSL